MTFNEMKKTLSQLSAQLKVLEALDDPGSLALFASLSSTTGGIGDAESKFDNLERSITGLARDLYGVVQQYSSLATSLVSQQGRVKRTTSPQLPNEIMVEIFKDVAKDGSHHLAPLLFVDRRFHSLMKGTPTLWTNIHVIARDIFNGSCIISSDYIAACLQNSQTALLTVYLDLSSIPEPEKIVQSSLDSLKNFVKSQETGKDVNTGLNIASYAVPLHNWSEFDPFYALAVIRVEDILQTITGVEGENMRRWKSLVIDLSPDVPNTLIDIGDLLCGALPNLEEYSFCPGTNVDSLDLNVSAVRRFAHYGRFEPDSTTLNFHLLTKLSVQFRDIESVSKVLSACTALQELEIQTFYRYKNGTRCEVHLPSLRTLELSGDCEYEAIKFVTPPLNRLQLSGSSPKSIPDVQACTVEWSGSSTGNESSVVETLRCILKRVTGMEVLEIRGQVCQVVLPTARQIQQEDGFPKSLRAIHFFERGHSHPPFLLYGN